MKMKVVTSLTNESLS